MRFLRRLYWFCKLVYKPYHFTETGQLRFIEPGLAWIVADLCVIAGPAIAALTTDDELAADAEAWRRIFVS